MRTRRFFLISASLIPSFLVPSLAYATTITGPYIGVGAGYDMSSAQHFHVTGEENKPTATKESDDHTGTGDNGSSDHEGTKTSDNNDHNSPTKVTNSGDNGSGDHEGTKTSDNNDHNSPTKVTNSGDNGSGDHEGTKTSDNNDHNSPTKVTNSGNNGSGDHDRSTKSTSNNDNGGTKKSSTIPPSCTNEKTCTDGKKQPGYPYSGNPYQYPEKFIKSLRYIRCSVDGAGRSQSGQISSSGNGEGQIILDPTNGLPLCMIPQEAGPYLDGQLGQRWRWAMEPNGEVPSSWHFGETWKGLNPYTLDPGIVPSVFMRIFTSIEGVFSGLSFSQLRSTNNLVQSFDLGHHMGFAGFAAFGWGFGNGLRSEIEGLVGGIGGNHNIHPSYGGFINVLYDIDLQRLFGMHSIVTPYVGIGGGYLEQHFNHVLTINNTATLYGSNSGFAWQGIAGVAIDTGVRGLQVTAQYSVIGQPKSLTHGLHYIEENGDQGIAKANSFNNLFLVGLRYRFEEPRSSSRTPINAALRTIPAPAPLSTRSYLVFFDRNRYTLSARDQHIVEEAALASPYVRDTRINVNGYIDGRGNDLVNKPYTPSFALSIKRAESIKAALIRDGVPATTITIREASDNSRNMPALTAFNTKTRKPQNRRVEIILHA